MTNAIKLSEKARATISLKDLGTHEYFSYETESIEVERTVAICANIAGEVMPIWFVETIGL